MEKALEYIFGSSRKLKILKLFYRNSGMNFSVAEIQRYTNISKLVITNELKRLIRAGIIGKKLRISVDKKLRKIKGAKTEVYAALPDFEFFNELRGLLMRTGSALDKKLVENIPRLGKIKLALLSGFFVNNPYSRVDLLLVGDNLNHKKMRDFFHRLESETGKALNYAVMNYDEYKYRTDMFDRFLADILESPHQKIVNKLNV